MNSNYPQFISFFPPSSPLENREYLHKHLHAFLLPIVQISLTVENHHRPTNRNFTANPSFENLIRHRLRSPSLPPATLLLLWGKTCTVGGKTNFTRRRIANKPGPIVEIPFSIRNSSRGDPAATRGGEGRGGVVKYKLPDRLGQTRSDNRSRAGGRATIPRRHPKFPAHFSPSPRVHGGGKLSAVFQTRSTSPFPSTLALFLSSFSSCVSPRESEPIFCVEASRAPTTSPVTRGGGGGGRGGGGGVLVSRGIGNGRLYRRALL